MLAGRVSFVLAFLMASTAIAAPLPPVGRDAAAERALKLVKANPSAARASGFERHEVRAVQVDADGTEHVRLQRRYQGLPVIGGDLIVHGKRGRLQGVQTSLKSELKLAAKPRLGAEEALVVAGAEFGTGFGSLPEASLVVYARGGRAPRLAWQVRFQGVNPDSTFADMSYIVDAMRGVVLDRWSNAYTVKRAPASGKGKATGTGTTGAGSMGCLASDQTLGQGRTLYAGTVTLPTVLCGSAYELRDAGRGIRTTDMRNGTVGDGVAFSDGDNVWGRGHAADRASAGADAHYGVTLASDYFADVHGRYGFDGLGSGVLAKVHFGDRYAGAFWLEGCNCIAFGDGDGRNWGPMVNLDTAGHELSHGVTSHSAGLIYSGESGALNEATSDIFGSMVEFHANNAQDTPDYMIGEQYILRNVAGSATQKAVRYMWNPALDGGSPACYHSNIGLLDVHVGSGVANHFFYLLAEGSGTKTFSGVAHTSPTCNGSRVQGIGRNKAAAIWFRALTVHMTSDTDYRGARAATLAAARDLYGENSIEAATVASAWSAVSVD